MNVTLNTVLREQILSLSFLCFAWKMKYFYQHFKQRCVPKVSSSYKECYEVAFSFISLFCEERMGFCWDTSLLFPLQKLEIKQHVQSLLSKLKG